MAKGWLDNYGEEDNYNDYQASAPEGFQGEGYSMKGRNYSPAWGGSFQMGGVLPGAVGNMYSREGSNYSSKKLTTAQDGINIIPIKGRSHYNPQSNSIYLDETNTPGVKGHEMYHAQQHAEGRDVVPDLWKWGPYLSPKKPQTPVTDEEASNYYNRRRYESEFIQQEMYKKHPELKFLPEEMVDEGFNTPSGTYVLGVEDNMYDNPYTIEGEARLTETPEGRQQLEDMGIGIKPFQNGGEMKFYQEGLDFKPKSIAQEGTKFLNSRQKRGLDLLIKETNNAKKDEQELHSTGTIKTPRSVAYKQKEIKPSEVRKHVPQSTSSKTWEVLTHPMTAAGYAARHEDLPDHFSKGAVNAHEQAVDVINPFFYANEGKETLSSLSKGHLLNAAGHALTFVPALAEFGPELRSIKTSIAPELRQGLQTNGISFANNPKRGENAFKLINDENKEWIGDLDLTENYWDDNAKNQWTIDNVAIEKPYRGKGFGKEAYIKANELLNSTGRGSLHSSGNFEGQDAKHLWRSLVNSGHAEKIGKNAWKFKSKLKQGGIIKDDRGQWAHPGEITEIGSNNITMQGVPYDVLGISDEGDVKHMKANNPTNYKFKGKKVIEFPIAKNGNQLVKLNQLTNFTNYNTPQPGGWLDKYSK